MLTISQGSSMALVQSNQINWNQTILNVSLRILFQSDSKQLYFCTLVMSASISSLEHWPNFQNCCNKYSNNLYHILGIIDYCKNRKQTYSTFKSTSALCSVSTTIQKDLSEQIKHCIFCSIPQPKIAVTIIHRRQYLKLFPAANILVTWSCQTMATVVTNYLNSHTVNWEYNITLIKSRLNQTKCLLPLIYSIKLSGDCWL